MNKLPKMPRLARRDRKRPVVQPQPEYKRFDLLQRSEHILFLLSFTLLALTGLPQKFPLSPISDWIFGMLGGVETARAIHHLSAIAMIIMSTVHILEVPYRLIVFRTPITMIPWLDDVRHVWDDILYYLGFRKHKAYYGRYSYAEKMEYLSLIWGTVVMAITGFMMWNPITTLKFLPGEAIPAAKAAHGGEALLAVLAIIIWHFYHVHIKMFNKSMFTGYMSREEMHHEHPAELAAIDEGKKVAPKIPLKTLTLRRLMYLPFAGVTLAAAGFALFYLVDYENTAINYAPPGETAKVFAPLPTQTPLPTQAVPTPAALTWTSFVGPLLQQKCTVCHGVNGVAGLNLTTYSDAMKGATTGPVIVSNDAANSLLYQIQSAGGHPGQLQANELEFIKQWIDAGAPEN